MSSTESLTQSLTAREEIPVAEQQITKHDMLHDWVHLSQVANKVPQYEPGVSAALVTGANCPRALEALEVVPGKGADPFTTRLRHGWAIYGPLKLT